MHRMRFVVPSLQPQSFTPPDLAVLFLLLGAARCLRRTGLVFGSTGLDRDPRTGELRGCAVNNAPRASDMDLKKTPLRRFMNGRAPSSKRYQPTEYEHAANCATHGLWILPSLMGGSVLYFLSMDQWHRVAAWLYGAGLTGLFITSTLFHTVAWKISHLRDVEQRFHMCDRIAIYFFIAASYSPWLMLRELGPWAGHMRWLVWVMACGGALYVLLFHERYKLVELLGYVCHGVFYVVGVVFFKSDGLVPFAHAIWHLFVALGAGVHYYAIWRHLYAPWGPPLQIAR
ncbi:unnamed protein product [Gadus morhua 'NCC']